MILKPNIIILTLIFFSACQPKIKKENEKREPEIKPVQIISIQKRDTSLADKKMLLYMDQLFKKRNTDLCRLFVRLRNVEDSTIRVADIKYPDFGKEHSSYQWKIYEKEYKRILKSLKIDDSLIYYINSFGVQYCQE